MPVPVPDRPTAARRTARIVDSVVLAALAYLPFLLSSPGRLSADTKIYLYLDPGRLLSRAPYLWDPHVGAGTVQHQWIGYLFPMGPFFWVFDAIGVPDWAAQRLWLGSISFAAGLGMRWLLARLGVGRLGALAGAIVYLLTPYQLAFTARISVLLLPWAGLPWLVGLAWRAARRGGWRDPALFALVVLTIASINAAALLLVGVAPLLALALEAMRGRSHARRAAGAAARIAVASAAVSLWWIAGLLIEGSHGLPGLQLTETTRVVAEASSPDDLVRGLGNWFFYGSDRFGPAVDQAADFEQVDVVVAASFALPCLALLAAVLLRWPYRRFFAPAMAIGVVVAMGAWPYGRARPYGNMWRSLTEDTSAFLALRNTPRAVPVVVLGIAALLGAFVASGSTARRRGVAFAVVVGLAGVAMTPVWQTGFLSDSVALDQEVPAYWREAIAELDRAGDETRVLELPGAHFATYRWGNTVDPITPGLMDRPYVDREVYPFGSAQSVDVIDAVDRRVQEGTFEPSSLAAMARLLGVGTVVVRSDLAYERFRSPNPRALWQALTDPLVPGLSAPTRFGEPVRNEPSADLPMVDAVEVAVGDAPDPPPVATFDVEDAVPIVRSAPVTGSVVVAGDGDGLVDAAAAGLIDGRALLLQEAALDDGSLAAAVDAYADLVLTDGNRRRAEVWFSGIRDTKGRTEAAGETAPDLDGADFRLDPFPDSDDDSRTVTEQVGGRAWSPNDFATARPEDRAVHAVDGDVRTAWRVSGPNPTGALLVIEPADPVVTDRITLVQPQRRADRVLTSIHLRFDDGDELDVELDSRSLTPEGQTIEFPSRTVRRLELNLGATTPSSSINPAPVGLAEVRLGDLEIHEVVRLPLDLLRRADDGSAPRLDIVLTRLRAGAGQFGRADEEQTLDRRFELEHDASFAVEGLARVDADAADEVIDEVLGTSVPGVTFSSTGHLDGDADARASRAFDGDLATAWTSPFEPRAGDGLRASLANDTTIDAIGLDLVDDDHHSLPRRLHVEVDGTTLAFVDVDVDLTVQAGTAGLRHVELTFPPVTGRDISVVIDDLVARTAEAGEPSQPVVLPVAVAEMTVAGVGRAPATGQVATGCRDDLVAVDGVAVPVAIEGDGADAERGLQLRSCTDALALGTGSHRVRAAPTAEAGLDIDRLVLSSAEGVPRAVAPRGTPRADSGVQLEVTSTSPTGFRVEAQTGEAPFWFVLGQSADDGWELSADSASVGPRQVVDGYANGWIVEPDGAGTIELVLRWGPQRIVWIALGASLIAALACIAVVVATRAHGRDLGWLRASAPWVDASRSCSPVGGWPRVGLASAAVLGVGALVAPWWVAIAAGLACAAAAFIPGGRLLLLVGAPTALALSRPADRPSLALLAIALVIVDLIVRPEPPPVES